MVHNSFNPDRKGDEMSEKFETVGQFIALLSETRVPGAERWLGAYKTKWCSHGDFSKRALTSESFAYVLEGIFSIHAEELASMNGSSADYRSQLIQSRLDLMVEALEKSGAFPDSQLEPM
jgi:hypothetical protein